MILQEQLAEVIEAQKIVFDNKPNTFPREALMKISILEKFATIITGIRRCGKSTLLLQLLQSKYSEALYLNFEDIRLVGFEVGDFSRLQKEIENRQIKVLFFDEIQLVEKWEIFVHQLLNSGYTIFVTGSNASLLNGEMGTHLTGRHLPMELFPFSFSEFLNYRNLEANEESIKQYIGSGGMPEYLNTGEPLILSRLIDDIIVRDIAVRHGIREIESLKKLALYLISNVGKPTSANNLSGTLGIKSPTTVTNYFAYFKDSYLLDFLPQFSYSMNVQIRNPKKVYVMDTGFIEVASASFSDDSGRRLENLVYIFLRRQHKELYYFKDKGECDFVIFEKGKTNALIQVCQQINDMNKEREIQGLVEAMKFFNISEGTIVTMNQRDMIDIDGYVIRMVPAWEYVA